MKRYTLFAVMLKNILKIFKGSYTTLNTIGVIKNNLLHNYKYLSSFDKNIKIAPVVKSNGYGHGILNVAKILESQNPPFFCVDSLFEAYELLNGGVKVPVLITGYTNPENLKVKKLPFHYALFTLDVAEALNKYQPGAKAHLFLDTGLHREGVPITKLAEFLKDLERFPNIKIEGVMSHLASSKSKDDKLFLSQIEQFKKGLKIIKDAKINPKWVHIAATGAIVNPQTRPIITGLSNMVRAGLSTYGFSSSTFDKNLKPALSLKTHLAQIKQIKKGDMVGYDGTFEAKKDMILGILPIGYYDGVDRGLSNKGVVQIMGHECPILGRVSMNITTVDITSLSNPQIGEEVIVYSNNPTDKNSISNVSRTCNKIPYEILVNLAESTRREVI